MDVIWERGKDVCGVLPADSDVYAALIPKLQIATRIRGEIETDVLDAGVHGTTMRWWNTLKYYPGVLLLLDRRADEDLCTAVFLQRVHLELKMKKILSEICIIKKKSLLCPGKWLYFTEITHSDTQINSTKTKRECKREQTAGSTNSVWLDLHRLFDGPSKVIAEIKNNSFAEVTKKQTEKKCFSWGQKRLLLLRWAWSRLKSPDKVFQGKILSKQSQKDLPSVIQSSARSMPTPMKNKKNIYLWKQKTTPLYACRKLIASILVLLLNPWVISHVVFSPHLVTIYTVFLVRVDGLISFYLKDWDA